MRYPASEKLEIIRTVEASHLSARQTLAMLGIPRTTYYRWYDRWSEGGLDALEDTAPHPGSVWNRLPEETRADIIEFALEHEDLTSRELAVKYSDEKQYFVSTLLVKRISLFSRYGYSKTKSITNMDNIEEYRIKVFLLPILLDRME